MMAARKLINGVIQLMNKPLTFLLSLSFLFLFSGSVYGEEPVNKKYWKNGKPIMMKNKKRL
jgi:hypothetical protein